MDDVVRIAMWSGPRNLSTALMRSWGNRGDTAVSDEPLYAHYLHTTGVAHPGRADVLAAQDVDWRTVAAALCGPAPDGAPLWYQKHMTHHVTDDVDVGWLDALRNAFLIRDPARVIASYARVREAPTLSDLGLPQQWRLFHHVADGGGVPPVVDADDLLADPPGVLTALCDALGVAFSGRMLWWPPGRRATDGVWAPHWYGGVERSTGFGEPAGAVPAVEARFVDLHAAADELYRRLHAHRVVGPDG